MTIHAPQLGVDVLADELMWDVCKAEPLIKEGASEEEPEVREMHPDGKHVGGHFDLIGER
jgi:fructose-1,6-bisphosphatase